VASRAHAISFRRFAPGIVPLLFCLLFGGSVSAQTIVVPQELPNLGKLELELEDYHDCKGNHGCYTSDLDRQAGVATRALQRAARMRKGESTRAAKLAVVLDIDETSLSNWEEIRQADFAYDAGAWNRWVDQASAPAIAGTLHFYEEAEKLGIAVFFITGRPESQRAATEKNLRSQGYTQWAGLVLRKPDQAKTPTSIYKAAARQRIVAAGYRIAVNIGDQMSDLTGSPRADVSVKLADPFYYIP
jgi:predicted secreted acid phosphatase